MFCSYCGSTVPEGSGFCQQCGARVAADTAQNQTAMSGWQTQAQPGMAYVEAPKKSKKVPIIIGAIVAVVAVIAVIIALSGEKIDYEATVRAYKPFDNSQGLPYTCGEVFDKYMPNAKWSVRESGDTAAFVDISGTVKGVGQNLTVTVKVTEDPQDSDRALFYFTSAAVAGGKKSSDEDEIIILLLAFFRAYDEGYADLSELL